MDNSDAYEEYKKLIKAVVEYSVTSYIKLQHPTNRFRKSSKEDFLVTLEIFFDDDYRFENFVNIETKQPMSTKELITFLLGGVTASMSKTRQHIINESISYWWNKHFHDMTVPDVFTIAGKVWKTKNSPNNKSLDYDSNVIYMPKKVQDADRIFFRLALDILLKESNIDIPQEKIDLFFKYFYLLLKVNNAFPKK